MYVVGILIAKFLINLDFLADDPGLVSTYTSLNVTFSLNLSELGAVRTVESGNRMGAIFVRAA